MKEPFPPGKLSMSLLADLLAGVRHDDPRVVVGPAVGEDAAVIDMGDRYLVAKSDPITFATDEIGLYAVTVNANDIATRGATPKWFLATLLLPEHGTDRRLVEGIFAQITDACDRLGVTLVGGHTEVSVGLDRPVVCGAMLGEVAKDSLVSTGGLRPGDRVLLTKCVPLEGASIIAREKRDELLAAGVPEDVVDAAADFLHDPGISVVGEAMAACQAGGVTSMHDPTEGGVATALLEMAAAAEVGLRIRQYDIPLAPGTDELCAAFGLDPLGTISSGSLLIGAQPEAADAVLDAVRAAGFAATDIGRAVPAEQGTSFEDRSGSARPIPYFEQDEIARIF